MNPEGDKARRPMNTSPGNSIADSPCSIDGVNYKGWKSLSLTNGLLELFVVPEIGGRIIQLRLGDREYFYVNPRHLGRVYRQDENNFEAGWKNYGGCKVWPAPQGWSDDRHWAGPPDPILDGGPYRLQVLENSSDSVAVQLDSADDEYTGLRLSREIRLFRNSATVQIRHRMRNTSFRPVRWALWQVTQQCARGGSSVTVPLISYRKIYGNENYPNIEVLSEKNLWRLSYNDQVAKFVVNPESGWLATAHNDVRAALVETFPIFRDLPYPDGGPLEFWVNGKGTFTVHGEVINMEKDPNGCDPYIETEVLSPLIDLEPGQDYVFQVCWHCCAMDGGTIAGVNSCAAIEKPLVATVEDKNVRVRGSFGLFQSGILEIVPIHRSGETGPVHVVGPAGPLEACLIDESIPFENALFRVALRLKNAGGKLLGTVDGALLTSDI